MHANTRQMSVSGKRCVLAEAVLTLTSSTTSFFDGSKSAGTGTSTCICLPGCSVAIFARIGTSTWPCSVCTSNTSPSRALDGIAS